MAIDRTFVGPADLTDVVRAAFGSRRSAREVTRLRGGTSKGVYRLGLDDGSTAILYRWHPAENYWPAGPQPDAGPFTQAAGLVPFTTAHARLTALGVRLPTVYLADGQHRYHPADLAVVEDVDGGTLETLLDRDPPAGRETLDRLGDLLRVMHGHTATGLGPGGDEYPGRTCEGFVLRRALDHLDEAGAREPRIAAVHERAGDVLRRRANAIAQRSVHGLIHGELGPDHVLVDRGGAPVLIDIEAVMFFDVEWEHALLELRFHDDYAQLRQRGLDDDRLRLYRLALYLSLVAGPLRLLDGDFPDRAFMLRIAEWNTERVRRDLDHHSGD